MSTGIAIYDPRRLSKEDFLVGFTAREDLAAVERQEIEVLSAYLPQQMSAEEIAAAVVAAIVESGAASAKDMGKVMNALRPKLAGRADMGAVSAQVKAKLGS